MSGLRFYAISGGFVLDCRLCRLWLSRNRNGNIFVWLMVVGVVPKKSSVIQNGWGDRRESGSRPWIGVEDLQIGEEIFLVHVWFSHDRVCSVRGASCQGESQYTKKAACLTTVAETSRKPTLVGTRKWSSNCGGFESRSKRSQSNKGRSNKLIDREWKGSEVVERDARPQLQLHSKKSWRGGTARASLRESEVTTDQQEQISTIQTQVDFVFDDRLNPRKKVV